MSFVITVKFDGGVENETITAEAVVEAFLAASAAGRAIHPAAALDKFRELQHDPLGSKRVGEGGYKLAQFGVWRPQLLLAQALVSAWEELDTLPMFEKPAPRMVRAEMVGPAVVSAWFESSGSGSELPTTTEVRISAFEAELRFSGPDADYRIGRWGRMMAAKNILEERKATFSFEEIPVEEDGE